MSITARRWADDPYDGELLGGSPLANIMSRLATTGTERSDSDAWLGGGSAPAPTVAWTFSG
jgi:hypothetical protein